MLAPTPKAHQAAPVHPAADASQAPAHASNPPGAAPEAPTTPKGPQKGLERATAHAKGLLLADCDDCWRVETDRWGPQYPNGTVLGVLHELPQDNDLVLIPRPYGGKYTRCGTYHLRDGQEFFRPIGEDGEPETCMGTHPAFAVFCLPVVVSVIPVRRIPATD